MIHPTILTRIQVPYYIKHNPIFQKTLIALLAIIAVFEIFQLYKFYRSREWQNLSSKQIILKTLIGTKFLAAVGIMYSMIAVDDNLIIIIPGFLYIVAALPYLQSQEERLELMQLERKHAGRMYLLLRHLIADAWKTAPIKTQPITGFSTKNNGSITAHWVWGNGQNFYCEIDETGILRPSPKPSSLPPSFSWDLNYPSSMLDCIISILTHLWGPDENGETIEEGVIVKLDLRRIEAGLADTLQNYLEESRR